MAIQATVETQGGLNATNAYLRIRSITVLKIVGGTDNNKWKLLYDVDAYINATVRNSDPEAKLHTSHAAKFSVTSDTEPSDPMNVAYANLKTQSTVSNVSDLV